MLRVIIVSKIIKLLFCFCVIEVTVYKNASLAIITLFNSCMLGLFSFFCCRLLTFSKLTFT